MCDFECAVNYVIANEGTFSDNPNDHGGATNYGISLRFLQNIPTDTLKKYGIFQPEINVQTLQELTMNQAKAIYQGEFWDHAPFQQIINQASCNYIFDMAVNMGIAPAIKTVQRATWAVMKKWPALKDDGILGNDTLQAIQLCGFMIMPALRAERANFYRNLCEKDSKQLEFLDGWLSRTYNRG